MPRASLFDADDTGLVRSSTASGPMRGLSGLATSAARTAQAIPVAQRRGVQKAALMTTNMIRDEIRGVTGDMRLSGVGKRGAKVGARFDIKGTKNPTALIMATGPLHLIERDTRPHSQPKNLARRRKRVKAFGGGVYSVVHHPGTTGKHPFEKGWRKAAPHAPAIFQREVRDALRRAWL